MSCINSKENSQLTEKKFQLKHIGKSLKIKSSFDFDSIYYPRNEIKSR